MTGGSRGIGPGISVELARQGPREADGLLHCGRVGDFVGIDDAYRHARLTDIN